MKTNTNNVVEVKLFTLALALISIPFFAVFTAYSFFGI